MYKKALVHEWFVDYSGAEKCAASYTNIWDDFDIYSLVDFLEDEHRQLILKGKHSHTSFIQNLPFAEKKFRNYLPLFPLAVEQFDLSEYDIIFSNSHAVAKGVLTRSDQLHLCYCHSPMRYAWDLYHQYLVEAGYDKGVKSWFLRYVLHRLRMWDLGTSNRVNYFMANSHYTARRIKKIYNRDAEVIYPPVSVEKFGLEEKKEEFYLTASRLVYYKRVDMIAEAFTRMPDKKLVIIGSGPEMEKIKMHAGKNVEILGFQPDEVMKEYMQKAKAFVFAAQEDFGIVVVEAQSCGTPVIALNKAGTAETVKDGFNGTHIREQSVDGIIDAVNRFESQQDNFDHKAIYESSLRFSRANFELHIKNFVESKTDEFFNTTY